MADNWVKAVSLNDIRVAIERRGGSIVAAFLRFGDSSEGMSFAAYKEQSDRVIKHIVVGGEAFNALVAAGMPKESGQDMVRVWPYVITPSEARDPQPAQNLGHLLDVTNSLHELESQIETAELNAKARHCDMLSSFIENQCDSTARFNKIQDLLFRLLAIIGDDEKPQLAVYAEGDILDGMNRRALITAGAIDQEPGQNGRLVCCCGRRGCELSWLRIGKGVVAGSTHTDCGYTLDAREGIPIDA